MCLPPHTTHLLQPLDRSVFGPFSSAYKAAAEFMSSPLISVNKLSFPGLVKQAWEVAVTPTNIKIGIRL